MAINQSVLMYFLMDKDTKKTVLISYKLLHQSHTVFIAKWSKIFWKALFIPTNGILLVLTLKSRVSQVLLPFKFKQKSAVSV